MKLLCIYFQIDELLSIWLSMAIKGQVFIGPIPQRYWLRYDT